jgi:hypothetical protein
MKQPNFILSLIISGPISPRMAINVYLQPLISKLRELGNIRVNTFDVSMKKSFVLRLALMWTINDFPTYVDLSRYSKKGRRKKHVQFVWNQHVLNGQHTGGNVVIWGIGDICIWIIGGE